jgi:hypothetical protein
LRKIPKLYVPVQYKLRVTLPKKRKKKKSSNSQLEELVIENQLKKCTTGGFLLVPVPVLCTSTLPLPVTVPRKKTKKNRKKRATGGTN